jgi:hypothetical protein
MKLAKTIACSAATLGLAISSAFAGEGQSGMNDRSPSEIGHEETFILLEPEDVTYYDVYGVDEDRDGVTDGYLFIGESDTLG